VEGEYKHSIQKVHNKEYLIKNACYSVTKYYLCKQNNKRSLLGRKQRSQVARSFLNRYQFSLINKVTYLFSISCSLRIILRLQLKGNLLLIHGDIDNNVHPGNTLRVVDALIRAGKRFDMLILPQQRHGFGDMNEYFYWKLVDYFSEHLKGRSEKSVDIPKR